MISVVVPNFNCGERLAKNLPKLLELLKKSRLEYEVILVDDASTDDSLKSLFTFTRRRLVKVIINEKNEGFGMTVDRGIRAAKGEIVFVLNAIDILPENPDYFKIMLSHFKDPKVFSVAALKRDQENHGCGEIYFEKGFFLHRKGNFQSKFSAWADGGSQALRRDYYLKIGGFDPLYRFYWEDTDLGYRAWKAGYEIHFEPKAVLLHQKSAGPIAKYFSEKQRRIMNLRNQFIFTWKNADVKYLLRYFLWESYHATVALKNWDWDFFRAYWQAMFQWPRILMTRWKQKKVTKLTDDLVLEHFKL